MNLVQLNPGENPKKGKQKKPENYWNKLPTNLFVHCRGLTKNYWLIKTRGSWFKLKAKLLVKQPPNEKIGKAMGFLLWRNIFEKLLKTHPQKKTPENNRISGFEPGGGRTLQLEPKILFWAKSDKKPVILPSFLTAVWKYGFAQMGKKTKIVTKKCIDQINPLPPPPLMYKRVCTSKADVSWK